MVWNDASDNTQQNQQQTYDSQVNSASLLQEPPPPPGGDKGTTPSSGGVMGQGQDQAAVMNTIFGSPLQSMSITQGGQPGSAACGADAQCNPGSRQGQSAATALEQLFQSVPQSQGGSGGGLQSDVSWTQGDLHNLGQDAQTFVQGSSAAGCGSNVGSLMVQQDLQNVGSDFRQIGHDLASQGLDPSGSFSQQLEQTYHDLQRSVDGLLVAGNGIGCGGNLGGNQIASAGCGNGQMMNSGCGTGFANLRNVSAGCGLQSMSGGCGNVIGNGQSMTGGCGSVIGNGSLANSGCGMMSGNLTSGGCGNVLGNRPFMSGGCGSVLSNSGGGSGGLLGSDVSWTSQDLRFLGQDAQALARDGGGNNAAIDSLMLQQDLQNVGGDFRQISGDLAQSGMDPNGQISQQLQQAYRDLQKAVDGLIAGGSGCGRGNKQIANSGSGSGCGLQGNAGCGNQFGSAGCGTTFGNNQFSNVGCGGAFGGNNFSNAGCGGNVGNCQIDSSGCGGSGGDNPMSGQFADPVLNQIANGNPELAQILNDMQNAGMNSQDTTLLENTVLQELQSGQFQGQDYQQFLQSTFNSLQGQFADPNRLNIAEQVASQDIQTLGDGTVAAFTGSGCGTGSCGGCEGSGCGQCGGCGQGGGCAQIGNNFGQNFNGAGCAVLATNFGQNFGGGCAAISGGIGSKRSSVSDITNLPTPNGLPGGADSDPNNNLPPDLQNLGLVQTFASDFSKGINPNQFADYAWYSGPGTGGPHQVSNGILDLYSNDGTNGGGVTTNHFSQEYGYFQFDAKLPKGDGTWPGLFLIAANTSPGSSDGHQQELDVMEALGGPANGPKNSENGSVWSTVHFPDNGTMPLIQQENTGNDATSTWNTYGVLWTPQGVDFYVDGKKTGHTNVSPNVLMDIIAEVTYNGQMGGHTDGTTPLGPGTGLEVRSINAWQLPQFDNSQYVRNENPQYGN